MSITNRLALQPNERIEGVVRQSFLAHAPAVIGGALLVLLAFFLIAPLLARGWIGAGTFAALCAVGVALILRGTWLWRGNAFVITNHRVVDVAQTGVFRRTISDIRFEQIEDVSVDIHGVLATLFHLGTIRIRGSGRQLVTIELRSVPHPEDAQERIGRLRAAIPRAPPARAPDGDPNDLTLRPTAALVELQQRIAAELDRRAQTPTT